MIDLHCHYLPAVDDGAPDTEAALELVRAAYDNGVRTSVLTPHVFPDRWDNTLDTLGQAFEQFRRAVDEAGIPMQLRLGAEIHLHPRALQWFRDGRAPAIGTWNGCQVLLLELPDGEIPVGAMNAVEHLLRWGAVPMLAHPERNKAVMRSLDKLKPFVDAGCLLQLTAASVCDAFGPQAYRTAHEILGCGWATVIATDAHNLRHRPPMLAEARAVLTERFGPSAAHLLTEALPKMIIGDAPTAPTALTDPAPPRSPSAAAGPAAPPAPEGPVAGAGAPHPP